MGLEIERKFLVKEGFKSEASSSTRIRQGYLNQEGGRTVRVRTRDEKAYLTIKGPSLDGGLSRFEWEIEIPMEDALDLLQLSVSPIVDKTRWLVPCGGHVWEVDEFYGDNEGLVMAEIELSDPDEPFDRPDWLGEEVTGDHRYYNSSLARHPFKTWNTGL